MIDHEAPSSMLRMAVLSALLCLSGGAMAQENTSAAPAAEETAVVQGPAEPAVVQSEEGVRLNFRGVPLDTVLDELSREAGFTIVREVTVEGRVDVVSHRPLSQDEVVELLNSVLNGKGFAAIRNGQVLTIVSREEAKTRNIPVKVAAEPEEIPNSDEMVTQIIPIRYADATQLLENLKPLLASYAVASANESSNAIILTDTQANIRRMAEIVQALDTSISSISSVKVFMLRHADASETATLLTEIFEDDSSDDDENSNRQGGPPRFFGRGGFGGEGEESKSNAASPAREAASRVVAVAETRTNSIVVAAPEELMETIKKLVGEIDTVSGGDVQIRVFTLRFAGAEETAELINGLFEEATEEDDRATQTPRFFGPGGPFGGAGGRGNAATTGTEQNAASDAPVNAEPDLRTNSIVVSAPTEVLDQIAEIVRELDRNPAKKRQVYVYSLKNSDPESVAAIVQGMFESSESGGSSAGNLRGSSGTTTSTGTNNTSGGQNTGNSANTNTGSQSRF